MREILAAADLIPGDTILPQGDEVAGYPHGALGRTKVQVVTPENIVITHYVDSEKPYKVIR
jgi:hypothetical protein